MTNPNPDTGPAEPPEDGEGGESSKDLTVGGPADAHALRDGDQTLADADQTQADADQTAADKDRQASLDDQMAAADDQAAGDRDLADGGDPDVHEASALTRNRSSEQRNRDNRIRSDAAAAREAAAEARDLAAAARDRVSDLLDRDLEALEAEWGEEEESATSAGSKGRGRATDDRTARAAAAEARARAAGDRREAAQDRRRAAGDRQEAQLEREALRARLTTAEMDGLTGTRTRAPGLAELKNEIDRTRRTTGLLAVVYVDVIGLKEVNDAGGHAAGDALLKSVVRVLRAQMRSYDGIIRVGGDEFVCVMSGTETANARRRFDSVQAALTEAGCGIRFGIAELRSEDDVAALIDRADQAMPPSPASP